jgi:hypothetical protein
MNFMGARSAAVSAAKAGEDVTTVLVPALWFLEMANVFLVSQRRHRLTTIQRKEALEKLATMQFAIDENGTRYAFGITSELAEKHGLTICDG